MHSLIPSYTSQPQLQPLTRLLQKMRKVERKESEESPYRRFLISHRHQAFELINKDDHWEGEFNIRRVEYKFEEDVISHCSASMRYCYRIHVPREVADNILSFLVRAYIDTREYAQAALVLPISEGVLRSWWRWYTNADCDGLLAPHLLMRQLTRTLCLLGALYDEVYTGTTMAPATPHLPTIAIEHPGSVLHWPGIKPHQLISGLRTHEEYPCPHFHLRNDHNRTIQGFHRHVIMCTGPRICDVMVGNLVDTEEGVYVCDQVIFPIMFLKIECATREGGDRWEEDGESWRRFADMVRWSMEGCEVYLETTREVFEATFHPAMMQGKKRRVFVKP